MADKKISELPQLTNPTLNDLLAIVNNNITQKITLRDLLTLVMGEGLPGNMSFYIVPAGTLAPDGEYYYSIKTDAVVPIIEGEISSETALTFSQDAKSKSRIDHSVGLPELGWLTKNIDTAQINDILFVDKMNGIAVSESGKIYKTSDAGRNWTQKYTNGGSNPITSLDIDNVIVGTPPAGTRARTLVAVGGTFFYYSTDLGETWTSINISVTGLKPGEKYISVSGLSNPYYVLGSKGTLVVVQQTATGANSVQYISSLAIADYTALKVMQSTALPGTAAGIVMYAIANITTTGAGVTGKVYKSTDVGVSFVDVYSNTGSSFNGLFFSDINNGWIAGGKTATSGTTGVVYKTTDGGSTWAMSDLASIGASTLKEIHFGTTGWAVGDNSTIVKTTDGGTTWTKDTLFITEQGSTHNLKTISAITDDVAYIADGQGKYFYFISDTVNGVTLLTLL